MASKSPVAVQGTKEILNFSRDHSVQDGLRGENSAFAHHNFSNVGVRLCSPDSRAAEISCVCKAVYDNREATIAAALKLASLMASKSPVAVQGTKETDHLGESAESTDVRCEPYIDFLNAKPGIPRTEAQGSRYRARSGHRYSQPTPQGGRKLRMGKGGGSDGLGALHGHGALAGHQGGELQCSRNSGFTVIIHRMGKGGGSDGTRVRC
jgi:hypothetical protein